MTHKNEPLDPKALQAWVQAAQKSAPSGDLQALNWVTPEGIVVKPLYTAQDIEGLEQVNSLPGVS